MRLLAPSAVLALFPTLAVAAMPPEAYEAARRDAPDAIVIAIAGVTPPPTAGWGECIVFGTVLRSERGSRYSVGDPVSLAIPCAEPDAQYPDGGVIYQDMQSLLSSTYGRAYLDSDGALARYQYDQLIEAEL
jgi:hypothetical protein